MPAIVQTVAMDVPMQFANARLIHCQAFRPFISSFIQNVEENPNWNKCLDQNGMSLARCIYSCEDNSDCEAACVDQFKIRTEDCPCEVGSYFNFIIHRFGFESITQLFREIVQVGVHAIRLTA